MKLRLLLLLFLVIPFSFAYQQSHLMFELDDSWQVYEQRKAVQSFTKLDMYLEVRNLKDDNFNPEDFARLRDGEYTHKNVLWDVEEHIVQDDENLYILSVYEAKGETYALSLIAPKARFTTARTEMERLYKSFEVADTQEFVEASWEQELEYPEELTFSEKHPFSWTKTIFYLIVAYIIYRIYRRFSKKRKKRKEKKAKKEKKKKHKEHKED